LAAFDEISRLGPIETVHLVRTLREPRDRSPAATAPVEVTVKEELLGTLAYQPAVVRMPLQMPLAIPVGDDA
jgi:hypothetical protein